jgi:dihydroorotase (multifunctional complex type)
MNKLTKLPGLIDVHVHLRDPGATHKEDFYTGTLAALAGGITTIIDMPNNLLPTTSNKSLKKKINLVEEKALCDCYFYFGADDKNWTQYKLLQGRESELKIKGLKIYMDHTTGPLLVESLKGLKNHFECWASNLPILVHAEEATILKAIQLATIYRKKLHLCHLSQESELEIVKWAKKENLKVTCEVTPHHLFLNQDNEKALGSLAMMRPPLRTKKDNEALWKALRDGLIDCIATDHAPHTLKEKRVENCPYGVPGLETMLPLMLTAVSEKRLTLKRLIELVSLNPARIFKIKIDKDTFTEVDLLEESVIRNNNLRTKCGWSPFDGWKVKGKVMKVFIRGKKIFENNQLLR